MSLLLLLIPLIGIGFVAIEANYGLSLINNIRIKSIALITSIVNLVVSLVMFILFDFSSKQYQFIEEHYQISYFDIYLGVDGLSIYFVLLTTIIMPIAILSNWNSIQSQNVLSFVVIMLLLETLLLAVFLVLDILLFYIFFESILPPLFLLIVRLCASRCSLCKLQMCSPNAHQLLFLGNRGNFLLNIAWTEKVQIVIKLLVTLLGSGKVDMVRAILPEAQFPVFSKKGRENNSRNGFSFDYKGLACWKTLKGVIKVRWSKTSIKEMSGQPKSTYSFYNGITQVSTKGSNSYVVGGPVLAARNFSGYGMMKIIRRRSGPAFLQSMFLSTGTGSTTNVLSRLDSLHQRAKLVDSKLDRKLYKDFMLNRDMYYIAYQRLKSCPGFIIPRINPTTHGGLMSEVLDDIIERLQVGNFKFTPGRKAQISNDKSCYLGKPSDILVQEVMRMVLETIYEPVFKDTSHGFRPNRGCHTALRTIFTKFTGCTWWFKDYNKVCFDSIPHDKLIELLEKKIEDQRFLELIRKVLNAGYLYSNRHETDIIGIPKGSIISPILANIFLHELDVFVEGLNNEYNSTKLISHPLTPESEIIKYLEAKSKNFEDKELKNRELKNNIKYLKTVENKVVGSHFRKLMYIRYADDWVIAVDGSYKETVEILNKVKLFCYGLGLTVSGDKIKIINSYKENILFLGTYIKHSISCSLSRRKGKYLQCNKRGLLLQAPLDIIRSKLTKDGFLKDSKPQLKLTWVPLTARQIVQKGNSVWRGYFNYYNFVHNKGDLTARVYWTIKDVVLRTLARKFKLRTKSQVIKRFGKDLTIYNQDKRNNDNKPIIVAQFIKPNYRANVLDFKENIS